MRDPDGAGHLRCADCSSFVGRRSVRAAWPMARLRWRRRAGHRRCGGCAWPRGRSTSGRRHRRCCGRASSRRRAIPPGRRGRSGREGVDALRLSDTLPCRREPDRRPRAERRRLGMAVVRARGGERAREPLRPAVDRARRRRMLLARHRRHSTALTSWCGRPVTPEAPTRRSDERSHDGALDEGRSALTACLTRVAVASAAARALTSHRDGRQMSSIRAARPAVNSVVRARRALCRGARRHLAHVA
jgi:hypothetical protein